MGPRGYNHENISLLFSNILAVFVLFFVTAIELKAQVKWAEDVSVEVGGGFMIPHRGELNALVTGHSSSVMLAKEWQVNGTSRWHYRYRLPTFGVELYASDLGNRRNLGRQAALSSFGHFPVGRVGLNDYLHFGLGIGYTDTKWDIETTPKAIALGSSINAAISIGYFIEKRMKKLDVYGGLRITHLSNSALVMPNLGTNNVMLAVGMRLNQDRTKPESGIFTSHLPSGREWRFQYSLGLKQVAPALSPFFFVHTLSLSYYKRPTWFGAYLIRTDLFYNSSLRYILEKEGAERLDSSELFQHGISLGWAQIFGRTRFELSLGAYTLNPNKSTGIFYNRFGFRHQLKNWEHVEGTFNLVTHFAKAHHAEVGVAWRLR